ncbi:hypothetical protein Tco_0558693 [Tanacetum coccineum]
MQSPEQAFVDYAYSRNNGVGARIERVLSDFDSSLRTQLKKQKDEVINKINTLWKWGTSNKEIIKILSKLFSLRYQAQSSLGEENRNSSPKRVHFVNIITIVRKEDEPKETEILESCAKDTDDCNLVVEAEKTIEKEPEVYKVMKEEGEPSDIGNNDKNSDLENEACKHKTELRGEGEWMEYKPTLD